MRMRTLLAIITGCVVVNISSSVVINRAIERYHNCDVYIDEADIPTQNTYCYYDRLRGNRFYCKTWGCDAPDCPPDQQITRERDCPYCPNTCTRGGRIFQVSDSFRCIDGLNRCRCTARGILSTRMGSSKTSVCRHLA
uniref:Uncharacterized protein LOC111123519 n=1 Tax=Crassostrea virginica TaxID=6565 RepID=A0A8B8D0L4_CRAVI|nr:uncharacterized protein LOC111123519 [Crassostrea virginica]